MNRQLTATWPEAWASVPSRWVAPSAGHGRARRRPVQRPCARHPVGRARCTSPTLPAAGAPSTPWRPEPKLLLARATKQLSAGCALRCFPPPAPACPLSKSGVASKDQTVVGGWCVYGVHHPKTPSTLVSRLNFRCMGLWMDGWSALARVAGSLAVEAGSGAIKTASTSVEGAAGEEHLLGPAMVAASADASMSRKNAIGVAERSSAPDRYFTVATRRRVVSRGGGR